MRPDFENQTAVSVQREVIGVVPAAGRGTRIAPLPCSKEIYPVRAKAACVYLLERMRLAGITKIYVVLRDGKWDIPAYLLGGGRVDIDLAYLIAELPYGVPYTVAHAVPFVRDATVAFGFPDMIFYSEQIFTRLLELHAVRSADVLLGLFPAETGRQLDIVDVDGDGRVRQIAAGLPDGTSSRTWGVALWSPAFSELIEAYVKEHAPTAATEPEPAMGSVLQAAIEAGLRVEALPVCDKPFLDIGTPDGLAAADRQANVT